MTALRDEVGRFFDDFVTAFCSFNGVSIAALYHVPGVALRGDGSIQCLQSRADVERFFQTAVDAYRQDGCRGIRFKDLGRGAPWWTQRARDGELGAPPRGWR